MKLQIFIVPIFVIGCTSASYVWVNQRNPNADYNADFAQCSNEAMVRVPQSVVQQRAPTSYSSNCTNDGTSIRCETSANNGGTAWRQIVANMETSNTRNNYTTNCMELKGWSTRLVNTNQTQQVNMNTSQNQQATVKNQTQKPTLENSRSSEEIQVPSDVMKKIFDDCRNEGNLSMPINKFGEKLNGSYVQACINREEGKEIARRR